jgi:hypothetical protein
MLGEKGSGCTAKPWQEREPNERFPVKATDLREDDALLTCHGPERTV